MRHPAAQRNSDENGGLGSMLRITTFDDFQQFFCKKMAFFLERIDALGFSA
jgi:hypothetical protein